MLSKRISSMAPLGLAIALLGLVIYCIGRIFVRTHVTMEPGEQWLPNYFFISQYTVSRAGWVLVAIGISFPAIALLFRKDWLVLVLGVGVVLVSGNTAALAAVCVQSLAGLAIGIPLWRWFRHRDQDATPEMMDLVMAWFLGGSLNAYFVWIAIHWAVNYGFVYWSVLLLEIALFHRPLIAVLRQAVEKARRYRLSGGQWVIAASALLLLPYALVPFYLCDDTLRHLYFPKQIALFAVHDFNPAYVWSLDTEMYAESHYAISYLLGGEFAIRLSNFGMAFMAFLLIEAYCRKAFGNRTACCTALILVSMPLMIMVVGLVFLESFNLLSVAVLTILVLDSLGRITARRVCLFFVLSTVAYLYKQQAVFLVVPLGFVLIAATTLQWRRGGEERPLWAFSLGAWLALAIAAPFLLQNCMLTGNPVFPWMNQIFQSPHTPMALDFRFDEPLNLRSLSRMTFHGDRFGEHGRFQFGISFFVLLAFTPLVFFERENRPVKIVIAILLAVAVVLWWKITSPNMRYFVGPLVPGSILLGLTMERLWAAVRDRWMTALMAMAALVMGVGTNLICQLNTPNTCHRYPLVEAVTGWYDGPECWMGHTEAVKNVYEFMRTKYGIQCRCLLSHATAMCHADNHIEMLSPLQFANWRAAQNWSTAADAFDWIFRQRKFDCLVLLSNNAHLTVLDSPDFRRRVKVEFTAENLALVTPIFNDKVDDQVASTKAVQSGN